MGNAVLHRSGSLRGKSLGPPIFSWWNRFGDQPFFCRTPLRPPNVAQLVTRFVRSVDPGIRLFSRGLAFAPLRFVEGGFWREFGLGGMVDHSFASSASSLLSLAGIFSNHSFSLLREMNSRKQTPRSTLLSRRPGCSLGDNKPLPSLINTSFRKGSDPLP